MTLFRFVHADFLALLVAGAVGCSLNPETGMAGHGPARGHSVPPSTGGSAGTAGSGGGGSPAGGSGGQGETYGPIWSAASSSIEVTWFSFFGGGARFAKTRAELSADELALVEQMATIPDAGGCTADAGEATVAVSANGVTEQYFATQYGGSCGRDVRLVTYEPVSALLQLAACRTAKSYDGSTLATAPSITAGDGCYHGLFNASTTTPEWWFALTAPTAGLLHVTLDACGDRDLELTLLDETGETTFASAASEGAVAGAACPELAIEVEAGSYAVHVDMRAGMYAGDFYLRADSGM